MKEIVTALGKEAYDTLGPSDRRRLDLFIWAGCCMHKDQNSFKGGNTEMMSEWGKLGVPGPIVLANKQNAALLHKILEPGAKMPDKLTEDEQRAFEASTCGGVKACAIAGAIMNNKDDKKGQGDKHTNFMKEELGEEFHKRFADTNNTRFGSYGLAAAELIKFREQYIRYLDIIQFPKNNPSLTNIEKNLLAALEDLATVTELGAMILYQQVITHPYMCFVRGHGTEETNVLDLGPLHAEVPPLPGDGIYP